MLTLTQFYSDLLGVENDSVSPLLVEQIQQLHSFRCGGHLSIKMAAIPTDEEIRSALFALPKNKALGPDGFTVEFFTSVWDLVGSDVISAVKSFFTTSVLPRQVNATVISLIPKVPAADKLSDFRPISLCNTVYKVIFKIIASRLQELTPKIVQRNHVGFVKGRLLSENALLASELVSHFNKEGDVTRGCLQIDITKAYDNVDWRFLFNILEAFELPQILQDWIQVCVSSPHYSIALSGELVGFFPGKKGLRQGDPISSSLFVIAMDILSKQLDQAALLHQFVPHPKAIDPLVTHLSFAMLIFFNGETDSLEGIISILTSFYQCSGLGLNLGKSSLFLDGGNAEILKEMADSFGLAYGALPVKYLGLPLMPNKMKRADYQPLIDKVTKRISSWTYRQLSFAGRLELIKSVLYSIFNFWAAVFPLRKGCIDCLERICNAFLWNGTFTSARNAKVSWESVCTPKKAGGLGLRRLMDANQVFSLKLIWLLFADTGSLWVAWIKSYVIKGRQFWTTDFMGNGSWIWRFLIKLRELARPFLVCQVRSEYTASFWHDNWTGLGPLINLTGANGPRVTGIRSMLTVKQAASRGAWSRPRGRHPTLLLLRACLPDLPAEINSSLPDIFLWRNTLHSPPAVFSSALTWSTLQPMPPPVDWFSSVWFQGNISKHTFIMWVIARDRMPTRDKLRRWGLDVTPLCPLCDTVDESLHRLFFACSFSLDLWNLLFQAAPFSPPNSFEHNLVWLRSFTTNAKLKVLCKIIFQAAVYLIWKERNTRIHTATSRSVTSLLKELQTILRAKLHGLDQKERLLRMVTHSSRAGVSYLHLWFQYFQP